MKYNPVCINKKKYRTEAQAVRRMRQMQKQGLVNSYYYTCDVCGAFHLTSNSKKRDFNYVILKKPPKKKQRVHSWI